METIKKEWFGNIRGDILSGMVVAVALIPEAIAFSIIAGLDPMVGLYASFCIAIVLAFAGGRTGMISAATASMALILADLVKEEGIEYMLLATIFTGVIQIILGILKVGKLLKFIPRPVMIGFVNALAIMIFKSQLTYFDGAGISMYILVAVGIAIIYLFPKVNKVIPGALIAIVAITAFTLISGMDVLTIGDIGDISGNLPSLVLPDVPLNLETVEIILPYSFSLAIVGLVESMLTARLLDEKTDTKSNKNREAIGQGIGNIVAALFGGMAGCAMIGQSMINHRSGGRGRLSTLVSGVVLMILILILNPWVVQIPVAVLVAVMIVVSISTFDWAATLRTIKVPKSDVVVMIVTVIVVLLTDNLAFGVVIGIVLSAVFFSNKMSNVKVEMTETDDGLVYECSGNLFFASTTHFIEKFDLNNSEEKELIELDFSDLTFWDDSAGDALDKVLEKYFENNKKIVVKGLNERSKELLNKSSKHFYEEELNQKLENSDK